MQSFIQNIVAVPFSSRQKRLAKTRQPLSDEEFARLISDEGGDREAAFLIYRKLGNWIAAKGFTPHPEDNLQKIYGIAEEELDEDLILDVLNSLSVPPPSAEQLTAFGPVDTSLQIAQLVALARRK